MPRAAIGVLAVMRPRWAAWELAITTLVVGLVVATAGIGLAVMLHEPPPFWRQPCSSRRSQGSPKLRTFPPVAVRRYPDRFHGPELRRRSQVGSLEQPGAAHGDAGHDERDRRRVGALTTCGKCPMFPGVAAASGRASL
jgi:hypothetical protein